MPDESPFLALLVRVRGGDQEAAAELVHQYEPEVRRLVRVTLSDPNLRRFADSTDICQSVLAAFFVRVAAGQFDLTQPEDLVRLLARMARNKLIDLARRPAARHSRSADPDVLALASAGGETPSDIASHQELLAEVRRRLTPAELFLADQRVAGTSWPEISRPLGLTAEAARKQLERAIDRVCEELAIDRVPDA